MAHKSLFKDVKYRNWVRAGAGLKYLKDGLEPFVDEILIQQHQSLLVQIFGSLPVSNCHQCNLKTLKPNHACDKYKKCPLGYAQCNCQRPNGKMACPKNVCGVLYDKIIGFHASTPPSPNWNNANSKFWCTKHWEFGKCFINAPGYSLKNNASDIDISGLLHVIINNVEFHNHIQTHITRSDIFSKAREIRNHVFHSSSMELDDTEADGYIDVMIAVLKDPKELLLRPECVTAVQKLKELKQNKLIIKQETEEEVLMAAVCIIEKERTNDLHQNVNALQDKVQTQDYIIGSMKRKRKDDLKELKKRRMEDKENLDKSIDSLSKRMSSLESKDNEATKALDDTESSKVHKAQLDYVRRKCDFKSKLIEIYKKKVIRSSVLPLRSGRIADINDVYEMPWMVVASEGPRNRQIENGMDITSLKEIFYQDGKPVKTIYILGEAGSGKSAFCKYMVYEWCVASAEEGHTEESNAFAEEMKKFEFLFFLSLRCNTVEDDNVHKMIENQFGSAAVEILDNESGSCLILMDGLDEWSPTLQLSTSQFQPQGIPVKTLTKDYTVITTSRPWKSRALNLDESEMDHLIELRGIRNDSIGRVVNKAMKYIDESCDPETFSEDLQNSPLLSLATVPFILLQLMCVWVVNKNLGSSRCEVFGNLVVSIFAWSDHTERNRRIQNVVRGRKDFCGNKRLNAIKRVPVQRLDEEYKFIILEAAKIAYRMCFANETYSVTISKTDLRSLNIDEQIENIFLELGLLTLEQNENVPLIEPVTSYSFVHTILQEYFAALYITTQCQASTTERLDKYKIIAEHLKGCKTIHDIFKHSDVLEMICALDPTLTSLISELIFKIVDADKQFGS